MGHQYVSIVIASAGPAALPCPDALRATFSDMNTESHVLETLADDLSITYQQVNGRMGVSGREFVNARLKKDLPGGAIIVVRLRSPRLRPLSC